MCVWGGVLLVIEKAHCLALSSGTSKTLSDHRPAALLDYFHAFISTIKSLPDHLVLTLLTITSQKHSKLVRRNALSSVHLRVI